MPASFRKDNLAVALKVSSITSVLLMGNQRTVPLLGDMLPSLLAFQRTMKYAADRNRRDAPHEFDLQQRGILCAPLAQMLDGSGAEPPRFDFLCSRQPWETLAVLHEASRLFLLHARLHPPLIGGHLLQVLMGKGISSRMPKRTVGKWEGMGVEFGNTCCRQIYHLPGLDPPCLVWPALAPSCP